MHHWVRGALGAAMVYPVIWHYSAPGPVSSAKISSGPQPVTAAASSPEPAPAGALTYEPSALTYEPAAPEREVGSRRVSERLPVATNGGPASEPELPRLPTVEDPNAPLAAVMPELKEVLALAAEVQQHAHNPGELAEHVQTLDEDPAKLAKLRAFAETFVQLPPPRGEAYLPSSSRSRPSTAR
ncbi:MAG: hypothetical protein ABI895_12575 [Deltaproteobacteria bacterium]